MTSGLSLFRRKNLLGFVVNQGKGKFSFLSSISTISSIYHEKHRYLFMQDNVQRNFCIRRSNPSFEIPYKFKSGNTEEISKIGSKLYAFKNLDLKNIKENMDDFLICKAKSIPQGETLNYLPKNFNKPQLINGLNEPIKLLNRNKRQNEYSQLISKRHYSQNVKGFDIHKRISSLKVKKRVQRKKKLVVDELEEEWQVTAYATGDEYDLEGLLEGLTSQGLYKAASLHQDATDVLHMVASYQIDSAHREIYFFREGSAVFWNVSEIERKNVLRFLKRFEKGKYDKEIVDEESESLSYVFSETSAKTKLVKDRIILNLEGQTDLEKYTFSNALAQSVKLGIWESNLDKYIDNIEFVSEELRKGGRVVLSQEEVLQRMGQLFALRHLVNLSSDLLDIPDFYWDHPELELLYKKTCNLLSITQRTTVMNEKINHCLELMELLKSSLSEAHAARLEWIIIILICVEVAFEMFHVIEKYI